MHLSIVPCGTERSEELIRFLAQMNEEGSNHIGYFGVGEADIRSSLAESSIPTSDGFQLAYENEKLVGAFGVDVNMEIGRAWLLGPVVDHTNWQSLADLLYTTAYAVIPASITELELFCDVKNINLHEFASRHGFEPRAETSLFFLKRASVQPIEVSTSNGIEMSDLQNGYFEQFESLHNELFPKTYFTAKQLVEKQDGQHRLLTAVKNGQLLGYIFCQTETGAGLGYIDFIGTSSSSRRQGVGTALLSAGLNWMFSDTLINKVNLTVHTGNEAASALYKKFGFDLDRVMRGYRKMVNV